MAVLMEIPLADYQAFIGRCDLDGREYHLLRNAIIHRVPEHLRDGNVVHLLCSEDDARLLLRRAGQFYPRAASCIQAAIDSPPFGKSTLAAGSQPAPPNKKTLGDILFADPSKACVSEDEWLQLVRAIAAGDLRALHTVYKRTHEIVFTLAVRMLSNREAAEEVTLDVFHELWRRASAYNPAFGSVAGWIMNQARSRAIDRLPTAPTTRKSVRRSSDVLRPAEFLWGRLTKRIANETALRSFARTMEAPFKPEWEEAAPGIHVRILARSEENDRVSMLVRLDAGTEYPGHMHADTEELYLLDGVLKVDDRTLHAGDFMRSEPGSVDHRVWSDTGCTCFLETSTKDDLL